MLIRNITYYHVKNHQTCRVISIGTDGQNTKKLLLVSISDNKLNPLVTFNKYVMYKFIQHAQTLLPEPFCPIIRSLVILREEMYLNVFFTKSTKNTMNLDTGNINLTVLDLGKL